MDIQPPTALATHQEDIDEITNVVALLEKAQQNESAEDFTALFQRAAVWVTGHGRRLTGRDEITEFTRRVLPGAMTEATATYDVVHILFVRPDVAVVNVRQRPVTLDGRRIADQPQGSPVYVMARNNGSWQIAAGQNTQIQDRETLTAPD
jgi:uncharacterized protein (TIGR02246 family)